MEEEREEERERRRRVGGPCPDTSHFPPSTPSLSAGQQKHPQEQREGVCGGLVG